MSWDALWSRFLGNRNREICYLFETSLVYTVIPGQLGLYNKIVSPLPPKDNSGYNILVHMQYQSLDGGPHIIFMTSDNSSVDDSDCHHLPFVCEDTRFLVGKGTPSCLYPWQQGGKMNEGSGSWICCEVQPAGPTDLVVRFLWESGFTVLTSFICACRDASFGNCTYNLTILDCLQGLRKVRLSLSLRQSWEGILVNPVPIVGRL